MKTTSWRVWLIDLGLAALGVLAVQIGVLQNGAEDWETWAKTVELAIVAQSIGPTVGFLAGLRAKWSMPPPTIGGDSVDSG